MDSHDPPFCPERCAALHNRLLARSIQYETAQRTERSLAKRFLDAAPEFAQIPSLDALPLYRFLALLDTTPVSHGRIGLLTPQLYQPDPTTFWIEGLAHEPSFILLYGQHNSDSPMDGGVLLDIVTYRAVWHVGGFPHAPPADQWVPLEVIFQKSLAAWDTGKFCWDAAQASMVERCWVQNDVEQALAAWDRLLSTIELRISSQGKGVPAPARLAPLNAELLAPLKISTFAAEFLRHASRPGFSFIAPGICTFTPASLVATYRAEPSDSVRRTHWLGDSGDEDWPTLLFPGPGPVSHDVGGDPNPHISAFDRDWGFGKFTVNRQSGLYIASDAQTSDLVRLITLSGLPNACEFRRACRWGPPRDPKLAELLQHWTSLAQDGTWAVDSDGICTPHEWFTENMSLSKVPPT